MNLVTGIVMKRVIIFCCQQLQIENLTSEKTTAEERVDQVKCEMQRIKESNMADIEKYERRIHDIQMEEENTKTSVVAKVTTKATKYSQCCI